MIPLIPANNMITPVELLFKAEGVLSVITVQVQYDAVAFNCIPLTFITMGLTKGATDPYAAYILFYQDIQSIAANGLGVSPQRLRIFNEILGVLAPKSVPFGQQGVVTYTVSPPPNPEVPGSSLDLNNGLTFYMYVPDATVLNGWSLQIAPSAYSDVEISAAFNYFTNVLSDKVPHLLIDRDVQLGPKYLKDTSAFARNAPYYGYGPGGAPFSSIENEVPFKSNFFGVLVPYSNTMGRTSRDLDYTSGSSISNFGIGLLRDFTPNYYQSALTPIYKFIDLDEVLYNMMLIWQSAVINYANFENANNDTLLNLLAGMQVPWSTFRIMLRQQIIFYYANTQAIGQGLTPEVTPSGFLPFMCGSNCFPLNPGTILQLPGVLNENLRMLKMSNYPYVTKNFTAERNRVIHIPVWGAFGNTVPINISVEYNGGTYPMFEDEPFSAPSIWDGTYGGVVADFNATLLLQEAATAWNSFMEVCAIFIVGATPLGGADEDGSLLQFTRYVNFPSEQIMKDYHGKRPPPHLKDYVVEKEFESVLQKTSSKKEIVKEKKRVYNPPNSTIISEFPLAVSGLVPISDAHLRLFPQMVLPVIEVIRGTLPTQNQVQVAGKETFYYTYNIGTLYQNSLAGGFSSGVANNVKGVAGELTELAKYVQQKSAENKGGFIGNLFSTIGTVGGMIDPALGAGLNAVGNVLGAIGI